MGAPSKGQVKRTSKTSATDNTEGGDCIRWITKGNDHVYMTKQEKEKDELVTFSNRPHRTEIRNVWKKWR